MLKPYKYLFYRIYAWQLRWWGEAEMPQINALFLVSVFVGLNLYSVINILSHAYGLNLLKAAGWGKVSSVVVIAAIAGIGYLVLVKDGRHKEIAKQFSNETKGARIRNLVLCIFYVIASFVLFFGWIYAFPPNLVE